MLKGAAALVLLPMLPAIIEAKTEKFSESVPQWKHYAVTREAGDFRAYIDGVEVTRPEGKDYEQLEELTKWLESDDRVNCAEIWGKGELIDSVRIT